jgi:hypothetical protein
VHLGGFLFIVVKGLNFPCVCSIAFGLGILTECSDTPIYHKPTVKRSGFKCYLVVLVSPCSTDKLQGKQLSRGDISKTTIAFSLPIHDGKDKDHSCTGTEALYRPYGP